MADSESQATIEFGPAVSLTYDGADPSHLETVLPCLSELELRATFYVTEIGLLENPQAWQTAQNEGHEIACHAFFDAADAMGGLPKWTLENVEADLRQARHLFAELFPRQSDCSFAYPGVEAVCRSVPFEPSIVSYQPVVERLFQVCRSAREGLVNPASANVLDLESIDCRDLTLNDLVLAAEVAMFDSRWAIFAFRGVGVGEGAVDVEAHRELCGWLAERREVFRMGPLFDLGMELRERQAAAGGLYSWSLSPTGSGETTSPPE
jgi:hypothetical protein